MRSAFDDGPGVDTEDREQIFRRFIALMKARDRESVVLAWGWRLSKAPFSSTGWVKTLIATRWVGCGSRTALYKRTQNHEHGARRLSPSRFTGKCLAPESHSALSFHTSIRANFAIAHFEAVVKRLSANEHTGPFAIQRTVGPKCSAIMRTAPHQTRPAPSSPAAATPLNCCANHHARPR